MKATGVRAASRLAAAAFAALALLPLPRVAVTERPTGALPPLVFVSRLPVRDEDGAIAPGAIPGIGPRDRTAAVGGRLLVREPGGSLRVLVDAKRLFDVADPCVSWDGRQILFSGLAHRDSAWRIHVIGADGAGLRALTRTDRGIPLAQFGAAARRFQRYDDVDPCWLPDGRVCFASTRYPMLAQLGDLPVTNLFVMDPGGGHPQRVTSERNGGEEPSVDPVSGRVVYSRWWLNLDRPSNVARHGITVRDEEALSAEIGNFWQTVSIAPDGRGTRLHAGDPRTREDMRCYKPALLPDGRILTLFSANPSLLPGPAATGIRLFAPGADPGRHVLGLAPGTPMPADVGDAATALAAPRVADPVALPDGRLLVSWVASPGGDFGLYTCRPDGGGLEPVLDLPGTHELDAAPLLPAPRPPALPHLVEPAAVDLPPTEDPASFVRNGTFRFDCLNVFANAPVDAPIPDAPTIAKGTRFRLFLDFQRQATVGRDPSILYRDSPLTPRGAIYENEIPSDLPLFGQLVDAHGRVLASPGGALAHVSGFGAGRRNGWVQCVGCHAGHSVQTIPGNFSSAEWFNVSPSASVAASSTWRPARGADPPGPPRRVVDRRARSESLGVAWVAAGRRGESVRLSWPIPIEVSGFVLYGIQPDSARGTDLAVRGCRITLYRGGRVVGRVADTGPVAPGGTRVRVPHTTIDAAKITLLEVEGRVRWRPLSGLAEIETLARLTLD